MSVAAFQYEICKDGGDAVTTTELCNRVKQLGGEQARKLIDYLMLLEKDK